MTRIGKVLEGINNILYEEEIKTYSLDEIRELVKPLCKEMDDANTDEKWNKFLDKYERLGLVDVIDKYVTPDLSSTADKIHYHQKLIPELKLLLNYLKNNK